MNFLHRSATKKNLSLHAEKPQTTFPFFRVLQRGVKSLAGLALLAACSRGEMLSARALPNSGGNSPDSSGNSALSITQAPNSPSGPNSITAADANGFVYRVDSHLELNGKRFSVVGPNIYWFAYYYAPGPNGQAVPPSQQNVREALAIAKAMGATTVRSHYLGIQTGSHDTVEPALNQFNASAFAAIDYPVAQARKNGLKLIIPLTDNYKQYGRSKYDFLGWRNLSDASQFYTNEQVISDFENYIQALLTHVNPLTNLAYKDDPTIMAWETGNELGAYKLQEGAPPVAWTQRIAQTIKRIAPNQLVVDGSDGINSPAASIPEIDIISDHLYPLNSDILAKDIQVANSSKKVLLIGEYDWTGAHGGSDLASFLATCEQNPDIGDLYWSLFAHDDSCQNLVAHNDGYTLYYPGNTSDMQSRVKMLSTHAFVKQGLAPPKSWPTVSCPTP